MQQEEIEHVEEVEQQSGHTTVCLDEATIIEQDEEEEEEIEEEIEEEEVDEMFTLELDEASECEDKEYLGEKYASVLDMLSEYFENIGSDCVIYCFYSS